MSPATAVVSSLAPDYQRLRQAAVVTEPYPHFAVPNFLSSTDVKAVVRDFPVLKMGGLFLPHKAQGALADLIDALGGEKFRRILGEKLGIDLSAAPTLITLRDRCQARDGQIHADSTFKLVTVLLYLNYVWPSPQGCLRILRSSTNIEDYACEIPPHGGVLACFKVQQNSWHGTSLSSTRGAT
jgi:hypothetical protein